jgi:hypothetical protein
MARVSIQRTCSGGRRKRLSECANAAKGSQDVDASRLVSLADCHDAVAAENRISIRACPFRPVLTDKRFDDIVASSSVVCQVRLMRTNGVTLLRGADRLK